MRPKQNKNIKKNKKQKGVSSGQAIATATKYAD